MTRFHKPMRRSAIRHDPVTTQVRAFVLARDRESRWQVVR